MGNVLSPELLTEKSGVAHREGRERVSHLGQTGSSVGIVKGTGAKFPGRVESMWIKWLVA